MSDKLTWTQEIMQRINELTPQVTGKSTEPDWFLLRQHFEFKEAELTRLRAELERMTAEKEHYRKSNATMSDKVLELRAENEELRRDKERLDLLNTRMTIAQAIDSPHEFSTVASWHIIMVVPAAGQPSVSIREAIDNMKGHANREGETMKTIKYSCDICGDAILKDGFGIVFLNNNKFVLGPMCNTDAKHICVPCVSFMREAISGQTEKEPTK
jgi:cell division protein FtsB